VTPLVLGLAMAQVVGLAADLRGTLTFSDSSTASWRPALVRDGTALDLENTPSANLGLSWGHSGISLGYGPRFTLRDVFVERAKLLLHGGYATYSYSGSRYRIGLSESVSYGDQSLVTLSFLAPPQTSGPPPSSPTLTQIGRVQSVTIASETTTATVDYSWSRRWSSGFLASYGVSGGLDEDALILPRQRTALGGASLTYDVRKHDSLTTGVGIQRTLVSSGYDYWLFSATEVWRHRLNKELSTTVTGGFGIYTSKDPAGTRTSGLYPVMSAGLDGAWILVRRRSYTVALQAGSTFTPVINSYTGTLQERAAATSTLSIATKKSSLSGTVGATQSFPPSAPDAVRTFGVGVVGTHNLTTFAQIAAGYRSAWQFANEAQIYSIPRYWTAFVTLTLFAPPIKF
jgi:hypothetical protein